MLHSTLGPGITDSWKGETTKNLPPNLQWFWKNSLERIGGLSGFMGLLCCTDTKLMSTFCLFNTCSYPHLLRLKGLFLTCGLVLSSQLLLILNWWLVSAIPWADCSERNQTDSSHRRLLPVNKELGTTKYRCAECHYEFHKVWKNKEQRGRTMSR